MISVPLSDSGLKKLSKAIDKYEKTVFKKAQILVDRLAQEGLSVASMHFSLAEYDGINDVRVEIEDRDDCCKAIIATGNATLFIEFGAGLFGYGHPEPMGYGPGTYPGKGHWDQPNGWYLPKEIQAITGKDKSRGNQPTAAMYKARKTLELTIQQIAAEVFND